MRFTELALRGVFRVELEPLVDERGTFARTFCAREFAALGLATAFVQTNLSETRARGTLRGLHFQRAPHGEAKLVRCVRGRIHDVLVDLRPDSPTRGRHAALALSAREKHAVYAPAGVAHGFLTLEDDCEVHYLMSEFYAPECASGVRWNDPAFGIEWPEPVRVISERDRTWPDYHA